MCVLNELYCTWSKSHFICIKFRMFILLSYKLLSINILISRRQFFFNSHKSIIILLSRMLTLSSRQLFLALMSLTRKLRLTGWLCPVWPEQTKHWTPWICKTIQQSFNFSSITSNYLSNLRFNFIKVCKKLLKNVNGFQILLYHKWILKKR